MKSITDEFCSHHEKMNQKLLQNLNTRITNIASNLFDKKTRRYEDIFSNFKGYFSSEDLKSKMDMKVDINTLNLMLEGKVD